MCILQTRTYWKVDTSRNWTYIFETQNWNILTDRAQTGDEKNGVIRLVMFTPRFMVIKMQKWLILCTFCWIQQNISLSFGKIFKCIWKVLFCFFRKYYGLCTSELNKISMFKNTGFRYSFIHLEIFLFIHNISRAVKSEAY